MQTILNFILNHGLFLFDKYGFRFADSLCSKSFGGDSYVTLEFTKIKMRFVYDRSQFFIDFSDSRARKEKWFSIDLIAQLITGEIQATSLVDDSTARFLIENMSAISEAFSKERIDSTLHELVNLSKERAKRMFG